MSETAVTTRCFVSYSGIKLPLTLVNELDESSLSNRNTFFRGHYDAEGRVVKIEKLVYNELEMQHVYSYYPDGTLQKAEITDDDDEVRVLEFDTSGKPC